VVYTQVNALKQAAAVFRHGVAQPCPFPFQPGLFNLAYSLIAVSDREAAERELDACIGLEPRYGKTHLSLAHCAVKLPGEIISRGCGHYCRDTAAATRRFI
jgi:hypothetical protein